jgi:hypothetical protein
LGEPSFAGAVLREFLETVFRVVLAFTFCSLAVDFVCGNHGPGRRNATNALEQFFSWRASKKAGRDRIGAHSA